MSKTITIPYISTGQMREVDRLMIEEYGIQLAQMMENAGRHLADLARRRFLGGDPRGSAVAVLAGPGGNGGGGLAAARHLHNWGAAVEVYLSSAPERMREAPAQQLEILHKLGLLVHAPEAKVNLEAADLVIDALIGYSLAGPPRGVAASLVDTANSNFRPVLSLDIPSGVDADAGLVYRPAINAAATMTLALPKTGMLKEEARERIGELYLADIGVPPRLYREPSLNLEVGPIFARESIIRLD